MDFDEGRVLGSDLCTELRERIGFGGLIVIVSANDDAESEEVYFRAGADLASGKLLERINALPGRLAEAHSRRFSR